MTGSERFNKAIDLIESEIKKADKSSAKIAEDVAREQTARSS
jgi:hypothetical protein